MELKSEENLPVECNNAHMCVVVTKGSLNLLLRVCFVCRLENLLLNFIINFFNIITSKLSFPKGKLQSGIKRKKV